MLNRQKALLFLLQSAKRPVSKLELTKWAFLLRKEMPSAGGSSFYEFLPYKHGPFSFCLYREMDGLIRDGYVAANSDTQWTTTERSKDVVQSLSTAVADDSRRIVRRFSRESVDVVVDYIYAQFPRYTVNSQRKRLTRRTVAPPAIYTSGYERLSVDGFLDRLIEKGILRIIDVRRNPIARRFGFHKSTLSRLAGNVQIEYVHVPELGIVSSLRQNIESSADYDALFDVYERTTLRHESGEIDRVCRLLEEKASVLVCTEADHRLCHRSRLATAVAGRTKLSIQHLGHC